jgi:hypothetical protein
MAKMGRREIMRDQKRSTESVGPLDFAATGIVNFIVRSIDIPATTVLGSVPMAPGLPIMREGFITETGFLPPTLQE